MLSMRPLIYAVFLSVLIPASASVAATDEPVDLEMVTAIREEGFNHSRVMDHLTYLTEVVGPRLTASPQMRQAAIWAISTFKSWGIENAGAEPFEFGRGWTFTQSSVNMITPHARPLIALPKAWSPGTQGPLKGDVVQIDIKSEEDFAKYKGKLAGKIVFMSPRKKVSKPDREIFTRYSAEGLQQLVEYEMPDELDESFREKYMRGIRLQKPLFQFLKEEGVLATVDASSRDGALVRVTGYTYKPDETPPFPRLVMALEHYNHVLRLVESERPVALEINVATAFDDTDSNAYNILAEIPGRGNEVVMLGAHYDSWHAGTGASDNAAGVAVVMEAMRILQQIGIKPKRAIRAALWAGEEQGLRGSEHYVSKNFASRPEPEDEFQKRLSLSLRDKTWPIKTRPAHGKLSAYFNIDNGSGKIRGIFSEGNAAVAPIFNAWFEPFGDLGAGTKTMRGTRGTDHLSFDEVGLPGFQFIQDPLDYMTRLHHTNIDTIEHVQPEDLKQAAVILASFVYHAAMRDEMMPRKPMPRKPD